MDACCDNNEQTLKQNCEDTFLTVHNTHTLPIGKCINKGLLCTWPVSFEYILPISRSYTMMLLHHICRLSNEYVLILALAISTFAVSVPEYSKSYSYRNSYHITTSVRYFGKSCVHASTTQYKYCSRNVK